MFKFIYDYVHKLDKATRDALIADASTDEYSAEIKELITAFCAEFKLDKYNKGIHSIVKRNLQNVKTKKPTRKAKKITSFNTLAGE